MELYDFTVNLVWQSYFVTAPNATAQRLPNSDYVFNLCENRYLFCVCLLAAAARRQICLLPPANLPAVIAELDSAACAEPPELDWHRTAIIACTSGSNGEAKLCRHSLGSLRQSAAMALAALGLERQRLVMLSTTPAQHMYGLEASVCWPLFSQLLLHDSRPFFPEDVRRLSAHTPWPTLLISTPLHLRALADAPGPWHLHGILSATDHLSLALAERIAQTLGRAPQEIYGSTETLSFACRSPLHHPNWQLYAGAQLNHTADGRIELTAVHLPTPMALNDKLQLADDGSFQLLGRDDDMVKIAGKRASLTELNHRLCELNDVEDGFCYVDQDGRIAAVVVGTATKATIRQRLQDRIDPVFLPRTIRHVASLPRNPTGKLSRAAREQLLSELAAAI